MDARRQIIIGNGVLGRTVARLLASRGERATVLSRHGGTSPLWDAAACDVRDAAQLAPHLDAPATLYVCAAPPYWRWAEEFPPLVAGIATACAGRRVDLVFADNLYAYGASPGPFTEGQPYRPCSRKGEVRRAAAEALMALHGQGELRAAVVRASDFFGPGVEQSCVGRAVVERALAGKPAYLIGNPDLPHAVTYVPDFARALVRVADAGAEAGAQAGADHDAFGACWHTPSHNLPSLRSLVEAFARHAGQPGHVKVAGPGLMRLIGLFNPAMRELREMLYLFERPCTLAAERTAHRFDLRATPLDDAVDATVASVRRRTA